MVIAQQRGTGKYVAIKIINKSGVQDEQLVRIRREYAIMKHIEHKNWVKLIDVIENPDEICIVMEVSIKSLVPNYFLSTQSTFEAYEAVRVYYIYSYKRARYPISTIHTTVCSLR